MGSNRDKSTLQLVEFLLLLQGVLQLTLIVTKDGFDLLPFLDLPVQRIIDQDQLTVLFFQLQGSLDNLSLQFAVHPFDLGFGSPKMGLVLDDAGKEAFAIDLYLVDGQAHGEEAAILSPAFFITAYPDDTGVSGGQVVGQVLIMLDLMMFRHQHADVLTDQFIPFISEQGDGRLVDYLDHSTVIDHNDAVNSRFEDGP